MIVHREGYIRFSTGTPPLVEMYFGGIVIVADLQAILSTIVIEGIHLVHSHRLSQTMTQEPFIPLLLQRHSEIFA